MTFPLWIKRIIARIEAGTSGYLDQVGWVETRARAQALDVDNQPIPWFTYPAVKLLNDRVHPGWRVLEFGAGMGTIWWSRMAQHVISLEHDPKWSRYISQNCSATIMETRSESPTAYISPALDSGLYEAVVVDGLFRPECLAYAPAMITDRGIIVLDDAQRTEYKAAVGSLLNQGYRILELHGPQPVSKHAGCTAILYRDGNVLHL